MTTPIARLARYVAYATKIGQPDNIVTLSVLHDAELNLSDLRAVLAMVPATLPTQAWNLECGRCGHKWLAPRMFAGCPECGA